MNRKPVGEGGLEILKRIKLQNRSDHSIGHLNINSMRNKFESLKFLKSSTIDTLVVAETKLDCSFTASQFTMEDFHKPYRYDLNKNGGGLLVYIREGIPVKELKAHRFPNDTECGVIEINVKKKK